MAEDAGAYMTSLVANGFVGTYSMQHANDRSEPLERIWYRRLPEFVKRLCLLLEYAKDGLGAVTAIDL